MKQRPENTDCGLPRRRGPLLFRRIGSRWYKIAWIVIIVLICLVISLFYLFSYQRMGEIYECETRETIVELKKVFLKSTVNNVIGGMETLRLMETVRHKKLVDQRYEAYFDRSLACDDLIGSLIQDAQSDGEGLQWSILIWDDQGQVLHDSLGVFEGEIHSAIETMKPLMSHYRIMHQEGRSCLFGFSKEHVDDRVKQAMATTIKDLRFGNDSYVWVNEVIDYDGGEEYAIRRIHPNLPETEGMYLSTAMEDIQGNLPYLEELEGIKKDGELFFRYYFKELNSEEISEKLTYARLYEEYDWIVAMGIQSNELERHIGAAGDKSRALAFEKTIELLAILLVVVLICLMFVFLIERHNLKHSKQQMELEFQADPLTNAKSRRFGVSYMEEAFRAFEESEGTSIIAIMLFDIDNFKDTNDRYGHLEGDRVLKEMTAAVQQVIRSSDELVRWGGDEFVGVFAVRDEADTLQLMEKVRRAVVALRLSNHACEAIDVSISIGASHFSKEDDGYYDALKRADEAMYRSKAKGGNTITML